MIKIVRTIDQGFEKAVSMTLVVALLSILMLSVLSILLRQFGIAFLWLEPLTRHLVFLATFLGGVLATGKGNHIAIDILRRFLESKHKKQLIKVLDVLVIILSLFTIGWLMKAGIDFTKIEMEFGKESFFGIHTGWLTAITPFGFGLIAIRFFLQMILLFDEQKQELQEGEAV